MNAELKSVLTTDQSQYLCLAPSWLLLLQSDIDSEDSEDSAWNNGKEVPRWGVAEIQKMSPSTTGRCYCSVVMSPS